MLPIRMPVLAHLELLGALLGALLVAPLPAQAHPLGEYGATVRVGPDWRKRTFDHTLGGDQFMVSKGGFGGGQAWVAVFERRTIVESLGDFERLISAEAAVGLDNPVVMIPARGYARGARGCDEVVDGQRATYRLDVATLSGLTYFVMTWGLHEDRDYIDDCVDEFFEGLRFPGPDSEFRRQAIDTERVVAIDEHELAFRIKPFALREAENAQMLRLFLSADDENGIQFYDQSEWSAEQVVRNTEEFYRDGDDALKVVVRDELEISGKRCLRVVLCNETYTYHCLVVPIAARRQLEVRYITVGGPDEPRPMRDAFFASLALREVSGLDLPPLDGTSPTSPVFAAIPSAVVRVLDASELELELSDYCRQVSSLGPGRWLVRSWNAAQVRTKDGAEPVCEQEGYGDFDVVADGADWLVTSGSGVVRRIQAGVEPRELEWRARLLARCGDGLVLSRAVEHAAPVGIESAGAGVEIVLRDAAGRERPLARLPVHDVSHLAADAKGHAVVCAMRQRDAGADRVALVRIATADGERAELSAWDDLAGVVAVTDGWLVTGAPVDRPTGVYLVEPSGDPRPLLTGGFQGVELRDGVLTVLSRTEPAAEQGALRSFRLDALAEIGPRCQPFSVASLNAIGAGLLDEPAPRTAAEVRSAFTRLSARCLEVLAVPLPTEGAAIEAMFGQPRMWEIERGGRAVLSILTAVSALEHGASWVEPARADWLTWLSRSGVVLDDAFAMGYVVANIMSAQLDDSEGAWSSGEELQFLAAGRRLFLGVDARSVQAAVRAVRPADASPWSRTATSRIAALFEEHHDNRHLRANVYGELLAAGRAADVQRLLAPFVQREDAALEDLRPWLALRADGADTGPEAAALVEELTRAVRRFPRDAPLAYHLGSAYERARPGEPQLARACYRRALALQRWGELATAAQAALRRLER